LIVGKLYNIPLYNLKLKDICNSDKKKFLNEFKYDAVIFNNGFHITKYDLVLLKKEILLNDAVIKCAINYILQKIYIKRQKRQWLLCVWTKLY